MPIPRKKAQQAEQELAEKNLERLRPESLEDYRVRVYQEWGFSLEQAEVLSQISGLYSADVRERYIKKGCSPETIYRILAP